MSSPNDKGGNVIDFRTRRAQATRGAKARAAKVTLADFRAEPRPLGNPGMRQVPVHLPWVPVALTVMLFTSLTLMLGSVGLFLFGRMSRETTAGVLAATAGAVTCLTVQSGLVAAWNLTHQVDVTSKEESPFARIRKKTT